MKALFEVTSIVNSWKPPFKKEKTVSEYEVAENDSFEEVHANNVHGNIFTLKAIKGDRALIEYDMHFMRKDMPNTRDRALWAETDKTYEFSFLWGNDGIAKKLTLKQVKPDA